MYKIIAAAVALAGVASAAAAPPYPSTSVCTETSTLIYRSTTAYSTYYVTHTLDASGYPAPTGSAPVTSDMAPYPTASGNATMPVGTGGSSATSSGSPAEQTGNAGAAVKPLGALAGLAGVAVVLL